MADPVINIGGSPRAVLNGWSISTSLNSAGRFTGTTISLDRSYRPAYDDALEVKDDGTTTVFSGLVDVPEEGPFGDSPDAIATTISAPDLNAFPTRRQDVNLSIPAGNLKAALTALMSYFDAFTGVTLNGSQADGPTLSAFVFDYVGLDTAIQQVVDQASDVDPSWVWKIKPDKTLLAFKVGTLTAPFNAVDGNDPTVGAVKVSITNQQYKNRVIVRFTDPSVAAYAFLGSSSGSTNATNGSLITLGSTTYTMQTTLVDAPNNVKIGATLADSIANLMAAINDSGTPGTQYGTGTVQNGQANAISHTSIGLTAIALTPGAAGNATPVAAMDPDWTWTTEGGGPTSTLLLGLDAALTGLATANDTAGQTSHGIQSIVETRSDITDGAVGQALADAELAVRKVIPQIVKYSTYQRGLEVGMTQTITFSKRNVNASFLITEVSMRHIESTIASGVKQGLILYSIVAQQGTVFTGNWRDVYKKWSGN